MQAKLAFHECLKSEFIPKLKALGFHGNDQTYRRSSGEIIYVVNLHEHHEHDRCCVNLGMHLNFLPASWARHALSPEKVTAADCEFRFRLAPSRKSDYWWKYRTLITSPMRSVRHLAKTYSSEGQPIFDRFQTVEDFGALFRPDDFEKGGPPPSAGHLIPQRGPLTMARIHLYLGNPDEAAAFAQVGLGQTPRNTALAVDYERILLQVEEHP